jgi:hypothetical protein
MPWRPDNGNAFLVLTVIKQAMSRQDPTGKMDVYRYAVGQGLCSTHRSVDTLVW